MSEASNEKRVNIVRSIELNRRDDDLLLTFSLGTLVFDEEKKLPEIVARGVPITIKIKGEVVPGA